MDILILVLEILGTIAFSISGAVEAMKKNLDLLGVIVLGTVTAVGGGIIRDVMIGQTPPLAFQNPTCAVIAICVAFVVFIVGYVLSKHHDEKKHAAWNKLLLVSDAIGLGVFTALGIRYTQQFTGSNHTALLLFVGVITGVGGGLLRDIFAGNIPYIFRKHFYATASIIGAVSYVVIYRLGFQSLALIASVTIVLVLRLLAAHFQWNLPRVQLK
jgi:uncharacterized membrane protein YeiH